MRADETIFLMTSHAVQFVPWGGEYKMRLHCHRATDRHLTFVSKTPQYKERGEHRQGSETRGHRGGVEIGGVGELGVGLGAKVERGGGAYFMFLLSFKCSPLKLYV